MRFSQYLKRFPLPGKPGESLLFSTLRASMAVVSDAMHEAVESGTAEKSELETLQRLGMLVPDLHAEREAMRGVLERSSAALGIYRAVVILNLDCNLACDYCYEEGFRHRQYINDESVSLLIEFLGERLDRGLKVSVSYYGGEALLSLDRIKEISLALQERAAKGTGSYEFSMVTNGTLLNRQTVEELLPLGFVGAKVSLDGPPQIHDRQRPFTSGAGSFDAIMQNLKEVAPLVAINLGGNYRRDNYREFPRLLDMLLENGIGPDHLAHVQFGPVTQKAGMAEYGSDCSTSDEPWVNEAGLYLREEIMRRGFRTGRVKVSACMVEMEHNIVVNWDGALYKCPAFMGWNGYSVGSLREGIGDFAASHGLRGWQNEKCLSCAYLPICFGGCRFLNLLNGKEMNELECRESNLDQTLEELVLQEYRHKTMRQ
ncbi:geopeptide radical SAM maturase [Geomesophilobacter sediminis]|uniref:Geopeptide radical SAM maturase n=1 Tax=Geomesophilobacter sediminis TaxID=2798584 RepID=A0A8J7LY13_9BACT|nr:geopeptide radical SAM maturase [Geomesophilobacter sediminis]MBJ6723982.1 geopeptide radical SAM maturase [Geomesophilobacter sediminis]